MKYWKLAFAALLVLVAIGFAAATKEEDALRKRVQEFQDAFNKHDAKALSAFFTKDADLINPMGLSATGPAEIEKAIAGDLQNVIRGAQSTFTIQKIRFLKPDVAILNMTHEYVGAKAPDGTALPAGKALVTGVASKQGNTWMWEAGRPMIPFTPPTGPATQTASPTPARKPATK